MSTPSSSPLPGPRELVLKPSRLQLPPLGLPGPGSEPKQFPLLLPDEHRGPGPIPLQTQVLLVRGVAACDPLHPQEVFEDGVAARRR